MLPQVRPQPTIQQWGADLEWEVAADDVTERRYVFRNITPGWGYRIRVCALNKVGWSGASPASGLIRVPDAPQLRTCTSATATVWWPTPTAAKGEASEYEVQYQVHKDDLLNGCVDEREHHRYVDAVAAAQRAMEERERLELLEGSGSGGPVRTRLGTVLPSLSKVHPMLTIEQRRKIWLHGKTKDLASSFRERRDGVSDDHDKGMEWVDAGATRATEIVVDSLMPGTRYRFRMRFKHDLGWASWGDAALSSWYRMDGKGRGCGCMPQGGCAHCVGQPPLSFTRHSANSSNSVPCTAAVTTLCGAALGCTSPQRVTVHCLPHPAAKATRRWHT